MHLFDRKHPGRDCVFESSRGWFAPYWVVLQCRCGRIRWYLK